MGFRRVAFSGRPAMRAKLARAAGKCGGGLAPARAPSHVLDLLDSPHPEVACGAYFDRRRKTKERLK
jgi:hypothetical protein